MGLLRRSGVIATGVLLVAGLAPAAVADDPREQRNAIIIRNDSEFDSEHGVVSGSGTESDPYVISGWEVSQIDISNTSAHVVITDNYVRSIMRLNWMGPGVHVIENQIGNLRVNENVRRTGAPTSGHIAHNEIGVVGQIRHFDGIFEYNDVRPGADWLDVVPFVQNGRAVNFDGFNGARFRHNTIYGAVRAQLHGHHHSSGFGEHSHHHGSHEEMADHTKRWHEVWITGNTIYADEATYALSYTDTAHAANDRTAASEQEPSLNQPHVHHTRVHLNGNKLIGSGLFVDVFNSADQRHLGTERGLVEIRNNDISISPIEQTDLFDYKWAGIEVAQARDIELWVVGNEITSDVEDDGGPGIQIFRSTSPAGIVLRGINVGDLYVYENFVADHRFGIQASQFVAVTWYLDAFETENVSQAVSYDDSAGEPQERP